MILEKDFGRIYSKINSENILKYIDKKFRAREIDLEAGIPEGVSS